MISIDLIQETAENLMDKAAIEIPDDYLDRPESSGRCEDGDLSSFRAAGHAGKLRGGQGRPPRHVRRYRCPRWYVKMGNEAQIEGGPIALEDGAAPRHCERHQRRAVAPQPRAPAVAHGP